MRSGLSVLVTIGSRLEAGQGSKTVSSFQSEMPYDVVTLTTLVQFSREYANCHAFVIQSCTSLCLIANESQRWPELTCDLNPALFGT